ncbi:MAG: TolC family protein, partial [Bacteroidia bacterium]
SIAAYGAYQTNAQRNDFTFFEFDKNNLQKQWYTISLIGLSINMPIFDGLQRHQKISQAQLNLQKVKNAQFLIEQAEQLELKSALVQFENERRSLTTQEQNIALAEEVFEVSQKKFNNGLGNNLELVNAETSLKEAQNNYFNALYDYLIARTDIQKSTGISTLK